MPKTKSDDQKTQTNNGANLGFDAMLWATADGLRKNTDAAEYNPVFAASISCRKKSWSKLKSSAAIIFS